LFVLCKEQKRLIKLAVLVGNGDRVQGTPVDVGPDYVTLQMNSSRAQRMFPYNAIAWFEPHV
jgi:hypothetical protein